MLTRCADVYSEVNWSWQKVRCQQLPHLDGLAYCCARVNLIMWCNSSQMRGHVVLTYINVIAPKINQNQLWSSQGSPVQWLLIVCRWVSKYASIKHYRSITGTMEIWKLWRRTTRASCFVVQFSISLVLKKSKSETNNRRLLVPHWDDF